MCGFVGVFRASYVALAFFLFFSSASAIAAAAAAAPITAPATPAARALPPFLSVIFVHPLFLNILLKIATNNAGIGMRVFILPNDSAV